jgi:lipopolysaccharide export system permease protein
MSAWLICLVSLLGLYIVIDLFNKLDEFVTAAELTRLSLVQVLASYYAYQTAAIFDRLQGVVLLLAAMSALAWMIRNNELLPLLAAGVPTRRLLYSLLAGSAVLLAVGLANRELLLPRIAPRLEKPAADPQGTQTVPVQGAYEPNGVLISGQFARPRDGVVVRFSCTIPQRMGGGLVHLTAREGRYLPPGHCPLGGGWLLSETHPARLPEEWHTDILLPLDEGKFFLRTQRVTFALLTRPKGWFQYASTAQLVAEIEAGGTGRLTPLAVQLHLRLVQPLLTLVMVWMGLAVILRDQARNLYLNIGLCVVLAGCFFAACYAARYLGESELVSPCLAAWLPLFLFGPLTLALHDGIHT